jgi:hypothetical protein
MNKKAHVAAIRTAIVPTTSASRRVLWIFANVNNFQNGVFAGHERQELRRRMMRNPGGAAIAATVAIGLLACAMGLGSSSKAATSSSAQADGDWSTNLSGLEPLEATAAMVEVAGAVAAAISGRPAMGSDD